ncbi:hypothetical protein [Endozoicomonas sp. OPT23]|uniref:hypothetical protein n=1 Tax=Endozoicomonas sp. OPT23 TaxID=2072845 RepID=UPI00189181B6|nr:hypothetical protein [Endozoicomonas sp. OPT23]
MNDDVLSCICKSSKLGAHPRTLDLSLCALPIVSVRHGRLFCEPDPTQIPDQPEVLDDLPPVLQDDPDNELPTGQYRSYCRNCERVNGVLKCECKIGGWFWDSWPSATLPMLSCKKSSEVTYAGGHLFCSLDELRAFHKIENCTDCRFSGSTLKCSCNKTKCGWSSKDFEKQLNINFDAYLDNVPSCTAKINNCNGTLRCGECWAYDYFDQGEWHRPQIGRHTVYGYCYPDSIW